MSIMGHLCNRNDTGLRMPKPTEAGDAPPILSEDPVMSGKKSVDEVREESATRATTRHEAYKSVADYDPILRAHCRLEPHKNQILRVSTWEATENK